MKLALWQGAATDGAVAAALSRIERLLAITALAGARMLLPELMLPGYNRPDLHRRLAEPFDGPWMTRLAAMARQADCGVTLGRAERDGAAIYNAATAVGRDGRILAHHRKIQLFGGMERESFVPGRAPAPAFDLEGRRAGLLICYDVEFPEHVRTLATRGVELLLVPTANPVGFEHVPATLVPARAHENRMIVGYANYCGQEAGLAFGGRSLIAGPDARALAAAGEAEALLIAELPPITAFPAAGLGTQLADFRPAG